MNATRFASIPRAGLFTPQHERLREVVRRFVERTLRPHAEAWEVECDFPVREVFHQAGLAGMFGAKYEPDFGGDGPDLVADAVITEELALCGSGGVAAALGAHKDVGSYYLHRLGTGEQKARWLVPAVAGESITALAVTEPRAGSDVAGIQTRAVREGNGWRVSGQKTFITNGSIADVFVVAAKTDPDGFHRGVSLFVVEAGAPGFVARRLDTLGWRTSHTGELFFEDVRLGPDALLGEENRGFHHIVECTSWERMAMALSAVAAASRTLELAVERTRGHDASRRPNASREVWRHRLAELATEIEAARSLAYHALRAIVAEEDAGRDVSMAKWFATELEWRVADEAVQVQGGYGYTMESRAQRAWRDARAGPIGGGPTEIVKELIALSFGM